MSATKLVDYTVYMTHTTLTPARGEPSFNSLSKLETQIHKNAANVPCPSLANGDTGHLVLTMIDADFVLVSPHHMYILQVAPDLFVPPSTGTGPQIAAAQAVHDEALRLFNECTMVEKILITQMRNTIDPKYFEETKCFVMDGLCCCNMWAGTGCWWDEKARGHLLCVHMMWGNEGKVCVAHGQYVACA